MSRVAKKWPALWQCLGRESAAHGSFVSVCRQRLAKIMDRLDSRMLCFVDIKRGHGSRHEPQARQSAMAPRIRPKQFIGLAIKEAVGVASCPVRLQWPARPMNDRPPQPVISRAAGWASHTA